MMDGRAGATTQKRCFPRVNLRLPTSVEKPCQRAGRTNVLQMPAIAAAFNIHITISHTHTHFIHTSLLPPPTTHHSPLHHHVYHTIIIIILFCSYCCCWQTHIGKLEEKSCQNLRPEKKKVSKRKRGGGGGGAEKEKKKRWSRK